MRLRAIEGIGTIGEDDVGFGSSVAFRCLIDSFQVWAKLLETVRGACARCRREQICAGVGRSKQVQYVQRLQYEENSLSNEPGSQLR